MKLRQYVIDAFAERPFTGNPAAVCALDAWLPDALMQSIAIENNLSETAFAVREGAAWRLRWFTPGGEVDLCGHATLATAYAILRFYTPDADSVRFETVSSGTLIVSRRADGRLEMEFPAYELRPVSVTPEMGEALGVMPRAAYMGRDLLCVLDDARTVRDLRPDSARIARLDGLLVHVTAPGSDGVDCVSRSFAPKLRIEEDPVCGSGHCHIVPYWAERLGKAEVTAFQASRRGGMLYCRHEGDKVFLAGAARLYAEAEIYPE